MSLISMQFPSFPHVLSPAWATSPASRASFASIHAKDAGDAGDAGDVSLSANDATWDPDPNGFAQLYPALCCQRVCMSVETYYI